LDGVYENIIKTNNALIAVWNAESAAQEFGKNKKSLGVIQFLSILYPFVSFSS